jgi:bifunctional non-homologous end joining protein LigD
MQAMQKRALHEIQPMLVHDGGAEPCDDPDWLFEVKYDGYRVTAEFGTGVVTLLTRNGADCTAWFPEVAHALRDVEGGPHVIDGELCVLDGAGRSNFELLHMRARRRRWYEEAEPVTYCLFDLLAFRGQEIMDKPLFHRKELLGEVLGRVQNPALAVAPSVTGKAGELWRSVKRLGLEGLVAKRLDSPYLPGVRSRDWLRFDRRARRA